MSEQNEHTESASSGDSLCTFVSDSEMTTHELGRVLGAAVVPGSVIALSGNLGAGKTRLVQGIAAGLHADRRFVNSPTFMLIQEYSGDLPIYHFDTYRLRSIEEFLELGAEEYFAGDGVCLIEWADRVAEVLPADVLHVTIQIAGETLRQFSFRATGVQSAAILAKLRASASSL